MKFAFFAFALLQGLLATFALYAIELIVGAFSAGWSWPFSVWLGMLVSIPGIGIGFWAMKNRM